VLLHEAVKVHVERRFHTLQAGEVLRVATLARHVLIGTVGVQLAVLLLVAGARATELGPFGLHARQTV
jgi:hypothetical protein